MIYVVEKKSSKIIERYDAWMLGAYEAAHDDLEAAGYAVVEEEVNFNGDMVIWVE